MKSLKEHFTPEQLRELLEYDADTGVLRWKQPAARRVRRAGNIAGSIRPTGYLNLQILGKNVLAHRAAWAIHFGSWPNGILDHINGMRSDNRIVNLRPTTIAQNAANSGPRTRNQSGIKGAFRTRGGRWRSTICIAGKTIPLGVFDTPEEAGEAYQKASRENFGEFAVATAIERASKC